MQALPRHKHERVLMAAAALVVALALSSHADARQVGDCAAPGELAARAEQLSAQWNKSASQKALGLFNQAGVCWNRAGLKSESAVAQRRAGDIQFSLGDYDAAINAYDAALASAREAQDPQAEARALIGRGLAKISKGRLQESFADAQGAVSIARALGDRGLEACAENVIARYLYRLGEYLEAPKRYEHALALARAGGDTAEEAQALYGIGQVHSDVGELSEALVYYERALSLWRAVGRRRDEVATLNSVCLANLLMGESQTALVQLEETVLPFMREAGDRRGEAAAHNNIGEVYKLLGDYETALSHYRESLSIYEQIKHVPAQVNTSNLIGDLNAQLGRTKEAQEFYERGIALNKPLGNRRKEAEILNNIGSLRLSEGKAEEAYELFRKALSVFEEVNYLRGQAAVLNNIGWYFGGRGEWRTASGHFRRALEFCRTAGDKLNESLTLYNLARSELETGDAQGARLNVEDGLRITESLRAKIAGGDLRASYFAAAHRQFELYVAVLMKLYASERDPALIAAAFEASERGRARSLLETLAESRADIRRGVDPALLKREREVELQLDRKTELRILLLGRKSDAKDVAEVERRINELTAERRSVEGQIWLSSPHYKSLIQPAPLTLAQTQREVLDADTLLLEYALGDERSFVWAVTPDSVKSFELPGRARVEAAARRVYELLTARNQQPKAETNQQRQERISRAETEYEEAAASLARMVLGPVAGELGRKRLVVVADGALQYLPFAALPVPVVEGEANARARFTPLIAEHEVVSLPSASVLALTREELRGRRPAPKALAVLADPVFDSNDERLMRVKGTGARPRAADVAGAKAEPYADALASRRALRSFDELDEGDGLARLAFSRREANAIMASAPAGGGMLALGFQASRATATGPELSQYRIVHFATHGLLNSEHPELSGVILSLFDESGRRQDGFLELHEIYNLNLPAELVVLSACQTALGKDVRGEGLVGLTRGFMYAGARRVVASLWKVDDSATAEMMGQFYREMLGKGMRPAEALRAAQLHMWQQRRWRSPYFWAAFVLQGEWR